MSKPLFKHAAAWLLALIIALVAAPGMALANDGLAAGSASDGFAWEGEHDTGKDEPAWTDSATDEQKAEVVLTVYTQYANDDMEAKKEFTRSDLLSMAAENATVLGYEYQKSVYVTDSYVTVDQLMGKVGKKGLKITDEDTVNILTSTGLYNKADFTNADFAAEGKFFSNVKYDGKSGSLDFSDLGNIADAPAVIALSWNEAKWADNADKYAGSIWNDLSPYYGDNLRLFTGAISELVTAENPTLPEGKKSPNGVTGIVVKTPASDAFAVYSQEGSEGEPTVAKEYTRATLESLATEGTKGFLYWNTNANKWIVCASSSTVDVNKLLSDAGLTLEPGDTAVFTAPDGFQTKLTYDQIQSEVNFYPEAAEATTEVANPEVVGTVLALNWGESAVSGTAGATAASVVDNKPLAQYRVLTGISEDNFLAKKAGGNRFATNPKSLTLVKGTSSTPVNDNETANNETAGKDGAAADKAKELAAASTIGTAKVTAAQIKKASALGATTITLGPKVKKIAKGAFKGTKIKTIIVKSKKLKKKSVKGSLKGSKVKTVKVQVGSKKANKKVVKKYKKIFTKKNAGKKVKVK